MDRAAKVITIAEARTAVNGRSVDKETKNRSSVRRLGYDGLADLEEVIERLWRQREEEKARLGDEYVDRGFVLCHDGGLPYQPDYLSNRLQRVLARTDLPYVTLHGPAPLLRLHRPQPERSPLRHQPRSGPQLHRHHHPDLYAPVRRDPPVRRPGRGPGHRSRGGVTSVYILFFVKKSIKRNF